MINSIYLRRKNRIIVEKANDNLPNTYLATALKNMESLGFTFSKELIESVRTLSEEKFMLLYKELIKNIKENIGAKHTYNPMYSNFPQQVMKAGDIELYLNAIIHYVTLATPVYEKEERVPLLDRVDLKVIDLGSQTDFYSMIKNLIQANSSISETDKNDIEWTIENVSELDLLLPEEIKLKENVGFIVALLLKHNKATIHEVSKYFKTPTDVLRLVVALSDGDVSLSTNTKFKKLKRSERRFVLGLIEECSNITEDMLRYKNRWIRLGEILHPNEYKDKYPRTVEAFNIIRNDISFETFGSKLESALQNQDIKASIELLKTRAGEFARRLDQLLRNAKSSKEVIEAFGEVSDGVSTPVLLQVMAHFSNRTKENELRTFFPKGNVAKAVVIENNLPSIDEYACEAIIEKCKRTLVSRFSKLPNLGKVYIDPQLIHYTVPFSQRSASKALRTIGRGSKIDMPEGNTIRFFTWWKEGTVNGEETGRVDIDLSAVMYDQDWNYIEHISYTNLRSDMYRAAHSGDITSAPDGASEFIDLDIQSIVSYGGRYVVASLNSFTAQPYCNLPECYVGWMMRQNPDSGEIYEPATVVDKIDITADTQIAIPVILDLVERKIVWTDLSLNRVPDYSNNIENNQRGMVALGKAMTTLVKPTLHDLFNLHGTSRGQVTEDIEEADTVFSIHKGITPFDIDTIIGEYIV